MAHYQPSFLGDARTVVQRDEALAQTSGPAQSRERRSMPMKNSIPPESPDAYVASLSGWQRRYAEALRSVVINTAPLREVIKWGHLVYFSNGPVLLIRAEEKRVLFGFWRGRRLQDVEPRLRSGGKYEMATLELVEETPLERSTVIELVRKSVALNASGGDPTRLNGQPASTQIP